MENVICGFIELNGELVKISSVDDLKALAARLGSAFTELTPQDYETLCAKMQGEYVADDCGVLYSKDGRKVFLAPIMSNEYMIKSGAIAIASYAFNELTIPASVRHIGSHAFRGCVTLEKVFFAGPIDNIGSGIFEACKNLSEIVVPKGCVEQFREQLPFYSEIITDMSEEE